VCVLQQVVGASVTLIMQETICTALRKGQMLNNTAPKKQGK